MTKGVLFDLDGVLVDSMTHHLKAWKWIFDQQNIPVSQHTLALHEGYRSPDMARKVAREAGIELADEQVQEIILRKRAYYQEIAKVEFYPNAMEVIHKVRAMNKKCAIVTSCVRKSLQKAVPTTDMSLFDYIITGDEITNGKPNPDPYLIASDKLNLKSDECVVIENAPLGIQSANAAGMVCIAITTTLQAHELEGADYVVNDIIDILPILRKLVSKS
jgi:beta-phosphoglucomutase